MPAPNAINPRTGKRFDFVDPAHQDRETVELRKHVKLLERQSAALEARDRFMPFIKFTSPDPEDPNDCKKSKYKNARHHDALARVLEEVEKANIPFLILCMPPRHGKSEQVSRRFPAWYIGRHPSQNVIVATYSDTFAEDFGAEVRSIMNAPAFKQIFPNVKLQRGGTAKDRLQTTEGGMLFFVGRGGGLTGRGGHCFVSGTGVMTKDGERQIQTLREGDEVLSFENGQFSWKAVQAIARRQGSRIFRVATAAGRVVEATADHPFYVDGKWIEAAELTPGDPLLCAVRGDSDTAGVRDREARAPRARGPLLLQSVLGDRDERQAARREALRALRRASAQKYQRRIAGSGPHLLLDGMLGGRESGGIRAACVVSDAAVQTLQRYVRAAKQRAAFLLATLCLAGARRADGKGRQPALEGWGISESSEAARNAQIPRIAASGHGQGRAPLYAVQGHGALGSAPYRREPVEQHGVESGDTLPTVSRDGSLLTRQADAVRTVTDTGCFADVYDIQVEGAHCFFANGVLVHNCLICDDLIKDDKEANSPAIRNQAWNWLTKVAMTRRMGRKLVIMTFTRWHSDDPIGRLTDPENPHYNAKLAKKIKIINLPAIAEADDPLGREIGEPLWPDGPDKFDLEFLHEQQSMDPLGFAALYQQRPSLLDGDLFKRENVRYYTKDERPEELRMYAASDHALGALQRNDPTLLITVGISKQNDIYIMPKIFWRRAPTDIVAEAMIDMAADQKPLLWWAGRDHITKSMGPFLRKRMGERETWINLREVPTIGDKVQGAQSIIGRFAMAKVYWPKGEDWVERAINELMGFPNALHDEWPDVLGLIGRGLQSQFKPGTPVAKLKKEPAFGTIAWMKRNDTWAKEKAAEQAAGGF